ADFAEQCEKTSYYVQNASRLREMGARIAFATDAGWKHTYFGVVHTEMRLLVQAGYSPLEVCRMATSFNADYLKISHLSGRVKPHLTADLVVVGGDPTESIDSFKDIVAVYRAGSRVVG